MQQPIGQNRKMKIIPRSASTVHMDNRFDRIDSKQLTSGERENLLSSIDKHDSIGYVIRILSPKEISANMLQTYKLEMELIVELPSISTKCPIKQQWT